MVDRNEAQLLNELLRDVGSADMAGDAADLEPRVLAAWDRIRSEGHVRQSAAAREHDTPFGKTRRAAAVICALAAVIVVAFVMPELRDTQRETSPAIPPEVELRPNTTSMSPTDVPSPIALSPITQSPITQSPIAKEPPITQSPITQSPIEFIPLMPMTERELGGSFQIVRVQMPRASLGALTSPLDYPSELVEADVLLGEDGMARAIRVSTNGSVYPWRSR